MDTFFYDFTEWMLSIQPVWAYLLILGIAYGENVLPPIPGDLVVVFGGYLAGLGNLGLGWVVVLSTIGGALGFMTMYALGWRIGNAVFDPHRLRWLPKRQIGRVRDWLKRYGYGVVAANRFLSGARSVISLTVGMSRMHVGKTTIFATLSALVWCTLIAYGGYALGENWERVGVYLRTYGNVFLAVMLLGGMFWLARYVWKKKSVRNRPPGGHAND